MPRAQLGLGNHPPRTRWAFDHYYRIDHFSVDELNDGRAPYHEESFIVHYPSGAVVTFRTNYGIKDGFMTKKGFGDRLFIDAAGEPAELWLSDGTKVLFTKSPDSGKSAEVRFWGTDDDPFKAMFRQVWVSNEIRDPHGLALFITPYNRFGPLFIMDASGRWISFEWVRPQNKAFTDTTASQLPAGGTPNTQVLMGEQVKAVRSSAGHYVE